MFFFNMDNPFFRYPYFLDFYQSMIPFFERSIVHESMGRIHVLGIAEYSLRNSEIMNIFKIENQVLFQVNDSKMNETRQFRNKLWQ